MSGAFQIHYVYASLSSCCSRQHVYSHAQMACVRARISFIPTITFLGNRIDKGKKRFQYWSFNRQVNLNCTGGKNNMDMTLSSLILVSNEVFHFLCSSQSWAAVPLTYLYSTLSNSEIFRTWNRHLFIVDFYTSIPQLVYLRFFVFFLVISKQFIRMTWRPPVQRRVGPEVEYVMNQSTRVCKVLACQLQVSLVRYLSVLITKFSLSYLEDHFDQVKCANTK